MQPKALVVDNNPVLLKAISTIVEQEGCLVRTAEDGLQALELIKRYSPDIVFTDLVMPLVDGEQLCKIIRSSPELHVPFIVIISAIPYEETQRIMNRVACDLCIVKGNLKEMRAHIREALRLRHKQLHEMELILGRPATKAQTIPADYGIAAEILMEKKHRDEIVTYLSEGVVELSREGKIVEVNKAAQDILDMTEARLIGLTIDQLGWGEHGTKVTSWLREDLCGRRCRPLSVSDENPVFRGDKVLTLTLGAVEGTNYFGICILRDITRQYRAEEEKKNLDNAIRLVKKMEAMSGMAGGVAHDFNNILTVICGSIDMAALTLSRGDTANSTRLLAQAKQSAQAAVELVRKISHFSAFGIINRKDMNIGDIVSGAAATSEASSRIDIPSDPESGVLTVSADDEQLIGSLHNIFQNSVEAGADTITIVTKRISLGRPLVESGQYVPAGDYVELAVSDDGRGIEREHLVEIFDPYFSSKQRGSTKGMGLGLAVVYSTIRNHGGYVIVQSEPGKGTTIRLYLPLVDASAAKTKQATAVHPREGTVLLLETEAQGRHLSTIMLEFLGFEVVAADDGDEALRLVREYAAAEKGLAAAVIDFSGTDVDVGGRMCREIRRFFPLLNILATSGSSFHPVMQDCTAYGFTNALPKPYTVDDLKHVLAAGL